MGNTCRTENREGEIIQDLVDAGRKQEACAHIWHNVVDEDQYLLLKEHNLDITNLVFEGGGTKGIAYCGAVKALHDLGILEKVTRFAGTSAGAYVAMKLCLATTVDDFIIDSLDNIQEAIYDSSKLGFIVNILRKFGWHSGINLLQYLKNDVKKATGDPNKTFYEWYRETGRELCVAIANVTTGCVEYCHPKTTPDMSIAVAVRTSMSIPLIFQPYKVKSGAGNMHLFCDGGLLDNYPLKAFDGWYLSMAKEDSFFHKLEKIHSPFEGETNHQTLGLVVFNAQETEHFEDVYTKRYGDEIVGERPDTKLARQRQEDLDQILNRKMKQTELINSSRLFLQKLAECDVNDDNQISFDEFTAGLTNILKDEEMQEHVINIFGTLDLDFQKIFRIADTDNNNTLSFTECVHMLQNAGAPLRQLASSGVPGEINGMLDYLLSIFSALDYRLRSITVSPEDTKRTVGIYTDYVGTTDFDMDIEDKIYAIKQGWKAVIAYVREMTQTEEEETHLLETGVTDVSDNTQL